MPTRPEHTDNALHVQVSRLRRALGEDAAPRVETCATGYRTRIEAGESDLDSFRALLQTAERHAAAESWSRARTAAESALRLWRGDPGRELPDDGAQLAAAPLLAGLRAARATVAEIQIVASAQVGPAALAERRRPATVRPTGRSVRAG